MAATDDPLMDCLTAIKTAWDAAGSLSAINGFYLFEKPKEPNVGFPYAVAEPEISVLDRWTCDNEYWDNGLTIWIYHTTPEIVRTQVNLVRAVFDAESLSLSLANGSVVRKRTVQARIEQLDETVYRGAVPISLYTSRPRSKA